MTNAWSWARKHNISILRTPATTSEFVSTMIATLKHYLAPRLTRHGVLVEVHGEGMLLLGESGVGKSEAAIELVKRGHRLIADDAVEIKKEGAYQLSGSAPELIRHYIELRGIGVINVAKLFGMGAIKDSSNIDMVVNLEAWKDNFSYDRLGIENESTTILGRPGSHADHPREARSESGRDSGGGRHEQPAEKDGLQRRHGVYRAN